MKLKIASLVNDSIVDGKGLRYGIYVQGCPHRCEGCHNPQTHDFNDGTEMDTDAIWAEIAANPLLSGITLSGGEPMSQPRPLLELAKKAHVAKMNVWAFTGWTFEELLEQNDPDINELLKEIDVLVDSRFILSQRSLELSFRGSKNQRILDVQKSLAAGKACDFQL